METNLKLSEKNQRQLEVVSAILGNSVDDILNHIVERYLTDGEYVASLEIPRTVIFTTANTGGVQPKIQTIRAIRNTTGVGLKEAKDATEDLYAKGVVRVRVCDNVIKAGPDYANALLFFRDNQITVQGG